MVITGSSVQRFIEFFQQLVSAIKEILPGVGQGNTAGGAFN